MWLRLYESVAAEGHWIGGEVPVEPGWADRVVVAYTGRDDAAALFAEADGVAVGWINMSLDGDTVALGMGIIESYRSQGIGSAMMEAAVAWAEVVRATRLRLEVFSHNERAIRLYRKFGFTEVESRVGAHERRTGERFDGLVMVRSLRSG